MQCFFSLAPGFQETPVSPEMPLSDHSTKQKHS
jgi:hypothetical protein